MEQVEGIEPSSTVWKTIIITNILYLHGVHGEIRTLTVCILSAVPLPIGLHGHGREQRT